MHTFACTNQHLLYLHVALGTLKENGRQSDVDFYVISPDYESFCKRWFEVVVLHPSANILNASDMPTSAIDLSPASASPYVYSAYSSSSSQNYYRDSSGQLPMRSKFLQRMLVLLRKSSFTQRKHYFLSVLFLLLFLFLFYLLVPTTMHNRYVEMNPDPQYRSDRPEWSYVRYDHTYNPDSGFQFEFQWMVTTVVLISQLVRGRERGSMGGLYLESKFFF